MTTEHTSTDGAAKPLGVGSSEGLGPLPEAAGYIDRGTPYSGDDEPGARYTSDQMRAYALAEVQRAVGAIWSRCQGKPHGGCMYLAHCGSVCNKCGKAV